MDGLAGVTTDIAEEVELGRTLLRQGHLDTAQRVLVELCQANTECAEAFRILAEVLWKKGDGRRASPLRAYADELDGVEEGAARGEMENAPSDAITHQHPLGRGDSGGNALPPEMVLVASLPASPLPRSPFPFRAPSSPELSRRPNRRKDLAFLAISAFAVAVVAALAAFSQHGKTKAPVPIPREELDRALGSGTLEALLRARDVARRALASGAPDADSLVRLVLVNAFLTEDYALDASKDADDALKVAEGQPEFSTPERSSLLATARSLLALAAGDRAAARKHADVAVGAVSPDPPAFALLASARVRALAGDSAGSARELDRALGLALDSAPVVVDWASSRLDGGDPVGARRALANLLEKHKSNSRARLLLAVSERALGETNWTQNLELACRSDAKISQTIRTACAVEFALQALLDGDRSGAARKAKAAVQTSEDPFVLGQGSLLLASLGEVDVAEEVLVHARRLAEPSAIPLLWADLAIQLGRGQPGEVGGFWEHPAGPERDLLALRLAYARSGVPGIVGILKGLPPGIQDIDWDIRAFAALASAGGPTKSELTLLEKRGEKGDPIVSYVLGILALEGKDFKLAVHRLEKAIGMQGDACQAAMLYQMASKHVRRGAQINKAALRAMRARNVKCGLPET